MTKKQAISIIVKCAKLYQMHLENYQIAFVYRDAVNHSEYTEVQFRSYHFLHFTGVIPREGINAKDFYRYALNNKISEKDFKFKDNHITELKLQILDVIMCIDVRARMIGNFTGSNLELYTEKVTGTTAACLGLIRKKDSYIPNSVLNEDIRTIVPKPPGKIYAIFKKKIGDQKYNQITFGYKNLHIVKKCIPKDLLERIELDLLVEHG